jgi:glycerophosphoryl diester phosphodiesterase
VCLVAPTLKEEGKMQSELTDIVVEAIRGFRRTWPRMLVTDLLYKVIAFVVLSPLVGLALKFFMASRGDEVLADQDILFFLLGPVGLVTLVVVGAVSLAILAFEQACLMVIAFGESHDLYVATSAALWFGARHAWLVIRMAFRVFVRVLLLALPFLAVGAGVALALLGDHDINYYLARQPPAFVAAVGVAGVLLAAMVLLIVRRLLIWAFALPLILFEGLGPAQALATSVQRTEGHRRIVGITLVMWGGVAALLSALPVTVVGVLGPWIVPRFAGAMMLLVIVTGGFLLLWALLNLVAMVISQSLFALLSIGLYDRLGSSPEARSSVEAISGRSVFTPHQRARGRWILAGLGVAGVLAIVAGFVVIESVPFDDDVVILGHRGAAGSAPENTLASVALAVKQGADIVEIDVQETSDGEVVVIHDSDLMRVGGVPLRIWEHTYDELHQVDIGSWYGPEFSDQRVPKLEEVLAVCRGKARVDIELKYYGHNERLEERVAEIVERMGMEDDIVLMSLVGDIVTSMKVLRPGWTVGLLTATAVGDLTTGDADFLAVHVGIATPGFIRRAQSVGKPVYVWTVNDQINMARMISRGADGIITDHPALARSVILRLEEMSLAERLMLNASFWMGLQPKEPPPERDAS